MSDTLAIIPAFVRNPSELWYTEKAIRTLLDTSEVELMVVDDCSPALGYELERICDDVGAHYSRNDENSGFAATVNVGLRQASSTGQHGLLVNADMEFMDNGWYEAIQADPADVVGGLLIYGNGLIQHAGIFYSIIMRHFDHIYRLAPRTLALAQQRRICPVTGALQLVKSHVIAQVGIYDEKFKMGYEDVDYCHRVFQAGFQCAYNPDVVAVHHESIFRHTNPDKKLQKWMIESWEYLHEKHAGHGFADYIPTMIWPDEL